ALDEPLIDAKIDDPERGGHPIQLGRPFIRASTLRWALEQCLRYRQTTTFMVDEGQHLNRTTKSLQLRDHAHTIYSLAETTGTVHILFGTYELLPLIYYLGESGQHNSVVHFPPYHLNQASESQEFERVLFTFQCHLPLVDAPDLSGNLRN